jgi:drug/metabolite transporter (DMT)-like permease
MSRGRRSGGERHGDATGYALTIGSYLLYGLTGALMAWTKAPESVILVLRYAIATATLFAVFGLRGPLSGLLVPGMRSRFLLMAAFDASQVLAYFFAVRELDVAAATFIFYLEPLWVALLAPRLLGVPTERSVFVALAVAIAGTGVILAPSLVGHSLHLSVAGVAAALAAGLLYALLQVTMKRQTEDVSGGGVAAVMCLFDTVFLLPLAVWQTASGGLTLTRADLGAAALMGVFTTALAFTMWIEGVARIRVQHNALLGLVSAVAAPVFAWLLLGQNISPWTLAGGALILGSGAAVILRARAGPPPPEVPL